MPIEAGMRLLKYRRTKIVATIGPASAERATIERLIAAGADVFRMNMSHSDHAAHAATYRYVRDAAVAAGRPVSVLADLSGPKIRVGRFANAAITLQPGARVTVTTRDVVGDDGLIPCCYDKLADDVRPGDRMLLADGMLELRVEAVQGTEVDCTVVAGGVLADRKGINLPGVEISAPSLTEKDRDDARFALGLGVDFLGLSFVRSGADVDALRELVGEAGGRCRIVAKIERPEALIDIDAILAAADAVMVARGDLGVELPPEQVPVVQHQIVELARRAAKPVVVATQMLESMVESSRATRAEVADVSHAVLSGADALMLSGETAVGMHPVEAVAVMDRIARQAEGYLWAHSAFGALNLEFGKDALPYRDAVARSTAQLSRDLRVRAVIVVSERGISAAALSAARPGAPIVVASGSSQTCRFENLRWGVIPVHVDADRLADQNGLARELARRLELAQPGDYALVVSGFRESPEHETPSITVLNV